MVDNKGILIEKYEEALETLKSKGWIETIFVDIISDFKLLRNDLTDMTNDRDRDMFLKGQLNILRKVMDLEITYKDKLDIERSK